ncbi:MAG: hypothetical protein LBC41_16060, partial [Clostridiales bacterium]|nr:hypothetical protein [Clostridiales bacterium]
MVIEATEPILVDFEKVCNKAKTAPFGYTHRGGFAKPFFYETNSILTWPEPGTKPNWFSEQYIYLSTIVVAGLASGILERRSGKVRVTENYDKYLALGPQSKFFCLLYSWYFRGAPWMGYIWNYEPIASPVTIDFCMDYMWKWEASELSFDELKKDLKDRFSLMESGRSHHPGNRSIINMLNGYWRPLTALASFGIVDSMEIESKNPPGSYFNKKVVPYDSEVIVKKMRVTQRGKEIVESLRGRLCSAIEPFIFFHGSHSDFESLIFEEGLEDWDDMEYEKLIDIKNKDPYIQPLLELFKDADMDAVSEICPDDSVYTFEVTVTSVDDPSNKALVRLRNYEYFSTLHNLIQEAFELDNDHL